MLDSYRALHPVLRIETTKNRAAQCASAISPFASDSDVCKERLHLFSEEALKNQSSKLDYARAQSELAEAIAQLAAIQRLRKRGH